MSSPKVTFSADPTGGGGGLPAEQRRDLPTEADWARSNYPYAAPGTDPARPLPS